MLKFKISASKCSNRNLILIMKKIEKKSFSDFVILVICNNCSESVHGKGGLSRPVEFVS